MIFIRDMKDFATASYTGLVPHLKTLKDYVTDNESDRTGAVYVTTAYDRTYINIDETTVV